MSDLVKDGVRLAFDGAISASPLAGAQQVPAGMTLVDFAVEENDRHIFVSVVTERPPSSAELCERLARCFRDSVFFHLFGDWTPKRIEFAVLLTNASVDGALVFVLQDELKRRIPVSHQSWSVDSAAGVSVMTPRMWRARFGPESLTMPEDENK